MSQKDWEDISFTDPKEHNPEQYIYIVHAIKTDECSRIMQNLAAMELNDGNTRPPIIDLSKNPQDISKKKIISGSLIGKGQLNGIDFEQLETWANVRLDCKSTTRKHFTIWN